MPAAWSNDPISSGRESASSSWDRKPYDYGTLVAAAGIEPALGGARGIIPKWRATADEDGHYCFAVAL